MGGCWGAGPALTSGALARPPEGGGSHPGPAEPLGFVSVHPRAQGPDRGAEGRGERRAVPARAGEAGDRPGVGAVKRTKLARRAREEGA